MTDQSVRPRRILPVAGAFAVAALTLAACGGSSGGDSGNTPSDSPSSSSSAPADGATDGGRFGAANGGAAASGKIAAIDGNTLQVQSTSEQTAVDLSASTSYTLRETTGRSAVTVGSCIVAVSSTSSAGSAPTRRPTAITASTISVSPATSSSCAGGFGGGRPSGAPTSFPSGSFPGGGERTGARPSGFPSGARRAAFGDIVAGKVTKVSGSVISVDATRRTPGSTTTTTQTDSVTVTATTTYTSTVQATRTAVKIGLCASAFGKADSTGAVSATRVELSSPQNGSCTTGFFGRGANAGGTGG